MTIDTNKISRKYQVGGSIIYQPVSGPAIPPPQQGAPQQGAQQATEEGPIDKDYIKALMGKGLTNDVNAFAQHVNDAYQQYNNMSDLERSSIMGQKLRSVMKGDLASMNNLVRNQEGFTRAVDIVKSNGAASDYAVTERGVMVKDLQSGRVAEVTAEEYSSQLRDPSKYKLLTNGELVNEREYNPQLINDATSINVLSNAVGMKQVKEEIKSVLAGMGKTSDKQSKQGYLGYGTTGDPSIEKAAQQIVGMGSQGYYKLTDMASDTSNLRQLQLAAETMWENLSENSRNLLKARGAAKGINANALEDYAKQTAVSLLAPASETSKESSRGLDFDSTMTENARKAAKGGDDDDLMGDVGYWEGLMGRVGNPRKVEITDGNGDNKLTATGYVQAAFQEQGKPVGETSIRNIPSLMDKVNKQNIIVGDNLVNPDNIDAIVYDNSSVANVTLPVKMDPKDSSIKVDRDMIGKYNDTMNKLKEVPAGNVIAKEQIINANGLPSDGQGNIAVRTANFLTFTATVANEALVGSKNDQWLKDVSGEARDRYIDKYRKDSKGEDIAGTGIMGWRIMGNGGVSKGQVYALISDASGPVASRYSDGKDLRVPRRMNTTDHLGNESQVRDNRNQSGGPVYGLK